MRSPRLVLIEIFVIFSLQGCGCFVPVFEGPCSTVAPCPVGRCVEGKCVEGEDGGGGGGDAGHLLPDGGCAGCRSALGCFAGKEALACGGDGGACVACAAGQSCVAGACVFSSSCNPVSCADGCCQGNTCLRFAEQSSPACGAQGASCAGCPSGQRCGFGACSPQPCGPSSCGTCCDQGECLPTSSVTAARCGASGTTCVACPPFALCTGGVCVVPPCNAGNCASGCCENGACVAGDAHLACGTGAAVCQACLPGQRCAGGGCLINRVGDPCSSDLECAPVGATAYCKHFTSSMNGAYPGGFCTRPCGRDSPDGGGCGTGQVCLDSLQAFGEDDAICAPGCTSKPQCRVPDYDCYYVNRGAMTACWLKPLPGTDGGEGDGGLDAGLSDAGP